MSRKILLAGLLTLNLGTPALAQQPQPQDRQGVRPPVTQQPAQQDDADDVVRITTNLVQLDAVVLDKDGRHVRDLRPEDFEIVEDGRTRPVTNFSYIDTSPARTTSSPVVTVAAPRGKEAKSTSKTPPPPVAPAVLPKGEARRIIVLAFDDLSLSFETMQIAKKAARKFIEQEMEPGDLMAVVKTGSEAGALQQLTTDKRQLLAAVDQVRWNPRGSGGLNAIVTNEGSQAQAAEASARRLTTDADELQTHNPVGGVSERISSINTLEALARFVRGLRELPGRKSIVILTNLIPIFDSEGTNIVDTEMKRLVDLANRSSVTFFGIDARGLPTLGREAAEPGLEIGGPLTGKPNTLNAVLSGNDPSIGARRSRYFRSQDGLVHLTRETGGFALHNRNDILRSLNHILDDHEGYYLLGYRPDEKTFDAETGTPKFRKLTIKVRRPGLKVRSRSGFYGTPEKKRMAPRVRSRDEQLVDALALPFTSAGVGLRLTALFGNEAPNGSFIRSLLHIEARDLTFKPEEDGWQRADIDLLAVLFHADGAIVGELNRKHTLRARGETLQRLLKGGLVYPMNVPVRKAGAYQLRLAVRDTATERIGSASEFVEVPEIDKGNRLALSGVVAAGYEPPPAAVPQGAEPSTEEEGYEPNPELSPAVRRFRRGTRMDFGYVIYNARTDSSTGKPRLTTQVRLFRDGKQVFASGPEAFDAGTQTDLKRLTASGRLRLGGDLTPGEYLLQVIVTDALAPEREQMVTQWTDFEIIG
ncbi:MAG: VWA domain-containing protein [Pyrinomonadaceae bacterium]